MSFYHKVSEKIKDLKFLKQERGAILVLTALLLPIIFGCVGIGYDIGNLYMHKARLQNVADAAALAGGRAFLDSQEKRTDEEYTKDGLAEQEYVIEGGYKTHGSNHIDADRAADDYINHNIRNLGEKVKSDKYSHFALKGLKKSGESYAVADEIFYRVGLSETVPLRFLPLLTNKYEETVRAGAVVLIQPGTPGSNPGGGTTTIVSYSMFDNLFTYSDEFITRATSHNDTSRSITSFVGDMVYTHGNNTHNVFYVHDDFNEVRHLWENVGSYEGNKINDAKIDTTFSTLAYIDALTKEKLKQPHVAFTDSNSIPKDVKVSQINDKNSDLYSSSISLSDGNNVYRERKKGILFVGEKGSESNGWQSTCYVYNEDAGDYVYVKGAEKTKNNRIQYKQYGGKLYHVVNQDGKEYFVNDNNEKMSCYIQNWNIINPSNETLPDGVAGDFDFQLQKEDVYKKVIYSNIFYFCDGNFNIVIDAELLGIDGEDNRELPIHRSHKDTPVYIIIGGTNVVNVQVRQSNVRPIVIVFSAPISELNVNVDPNATFSGIIYAPYSTGGVHFNNKGTMLGNVIGHKIHIQNNGESHWIQKNFLENSGNFTDVDVAKVTQEITEANKTNGLTDEIKAEIRSKLNIPEGIEMGDMNYYNNLSYDAKQQLYRSWKELYEKYKYNEAVRNHLWPWNQHFNVQSGEETVATGETLRLINYRTEYQTKADGSIEEGKVLDPFIFETLGAPNSY